MPSLYKPTPNPFLKAGEAGYHPAQSTKEAMRIGKGEAGKAGKTKF